MKTANIVNNTLASRTVGNILNGECKIAKKGIYMDIEINNDFYRFPIVSHAKCENRIFVTVKDPTNPSDRYPYAIIIADLED